MAAAAGPHEVRLSQPDDFHHHLRDGECLPSVLLHACRQFDRVVVMPNIKPPVLTVADALAYRQRILAACPPGAATTFLMTLYLTDKTTPEDILAARASPHVCGCKLYPQGATTNSDHGPSSILPLYPLFQCMADCGLPLLIHGEATDPSSDVFDRERLFIEQTLTPLVTAIPTLRIVLEHITTAGGLCSLCCLVSLCLYVSTVCLPMFVRPFVCMARHPLLCQFTTCVHRSISPSLFAFPL